MKKLIAILSVVLFANQASADVELVCNAWSGTYSDGRPFILKKENTVLKFKNYLGYPVTASFIGNYNKSFSIYQQSGLLNDFSRIFYFNDPDTAEREGDPTLVMTSVFGTYNAAKCYRK